MAYRDKSVPLTSEEWALRLAKKKVRTAKANKRHRELHAETVRQQKVESTARRTGIRSERKREQRWRFKVKYARRDPREVNGMFKAALFKLQNPKFVFVLRGRKTKERLTMELPKW